MIYLVSAIYLIAMVYGGFTGYAESAKEYEFIEIHGTPVNDCWCPDDCPPIEGVDPASVPVID